MEATQKKGFFRGRLAKTFSLVTKRTSSGGNGSSSSQVVPFSAPSMAGRKSQSTANYSSIPRVVPTYSYATSKQPPSFLHEQKNVENYILPYSSMHKVSYNARFKPSSLYDQNSYANETWGHADENVNFKATTYITNVKQRFSKLDRIDST